MTFPTRLLCALACSTLLALPATSLAGDDDDEASAGPVAASAVTQDSARVTGVVTLGKEHDASYWFEYGTSPALGKETVRGATSHDVDDNNHQVTVSRTLNGLAAGTRHYVRLVVMDERGRGSGPTTSFTTTPAAQSPGTVPTAPGQPTRPGGPPPAGPAHAAPPAPELGRSVVVAGAGGTVRVKPRGSDSFVPLDAAASIPVGSVVDARRGSVSLSAARNAHGAIQEGSFGGSRFVVRQRRHGHGYTNLHLRGGGLHGCAGRDGRAVAAAAGERRKRARRLWARDRGGRFRTHGRDSVATVRGTRWTMTDRCDGTRTKVTEGAVDVKVRRTGRIVRVSAGERHLARHRP